MTAGKLPQPVAEEILRRYADVLRVGCLEVNGEAVRWNTDTSTELQLHNFCGAFFGRLRRLPELSKASDEILRQASYWVCKAVSINYALIEVLMLVKRKVGVMCTIETRDDAGGLVSYSIEARPSQVMHIRLGWRGKDNIVYRDPATAAKKVKGTLSCLETEFCLPPAQRFAPAYRLQMQFKKSLAAKFVSKVACKDPRGRGAEGCPTETILIQDPLRSEYPLESCPLDTSQVLAEVAMDMDDLCEDLLSRANSLPPSSPFSLPLKSQPRSFTARSVKLTRSLGDGSSSAGGSQPAGHLRVRVLRVRDLARKRRSLVDALAGYSCSAYCRCSVAGLTEQTTASPVSSSPEWLEGWDFPVSERDLRGEVVLEVFDAAGRELLGRACVPVSAVLVGSGKALAAEPLEGDALGLVELELEFLSREPEGAAGAGRATAAGAPDVASDSEESECAVEVGGRASSRNSSPSRRSVIV